MFTLNSFEHFFSTHPPLFATHFFCSALFPRQYHFHVDPTLRLSLRFQVPSANSFVIWAPWQTFASFSIFSVANLAAASLFVKAPTNANLNMSTASRCEVLLAHGTKVNKAGEVSGALVVCRLLAARFPISVLSSEFNRNSFCNIQNCFTAFLTLSQEEHQECLSILLAQHAEINHTESVSPGL